MPSSLAPSKMSLVMDTSAPLGVGSLEGWLWTMMMLVAQSMMACRSTSAGLTTDELTLPW